MKVGTPLIMVITPSTFWFGWNMLNRGGHVMIATGSAPVIKPMTVVEKPLILSQNCAIMNRGRPTKVPMARA